MALKRIGLWEKAGNILFDVKYNIVLKDVKTCAHYDCNHHIDKGVEFIKIPDGYDSLGNAYYKAWYSHSDYFDDYVYDPQTVYADYNGYAYTLDMLDHIVYL